MEHSSNKHKLDLRKQASNIYLGRETMLSSNRNHRLVGIQSKSRHSLIMKNTSLSIGCSCHTCLAKLLFYTHLDRLTRFKKRIQMFWLNYWNSQCCRTQVTSSKFAQAQSIKKVSL